MGKQPYEIIPLERVGPIYLGMTRDESRKAMRLAYKERTGKGYKPDIAADVYVNGIDVYFDEQDLVHSIEIYWNPGIEVLIDKISVFDTPRDWLTKEIARLYEVTPTPEFGGDSVSFSALQLWLWGFKELTDDIYDEDDNLISESLSSCYTIGIAVGGTFP